MRIWAISDTHGRHRELEVPQYDLVIYAGDEANDPSPYKNERESLDFFDWFYDLPGHKVFVPGNHSVAIERGWVKPKVPCLIDSYIDVEGVGIYGSPWSPTFGSSRWVYHKDRSKMRDVWDMMPKCDILVTHGPPKGILDLARDINDKGLVHCGCRSLRSKVMEIKPKLMCFGHIHNDKDIWNSGIYINHGITFVNASVVDNQLNLINNGFVVEVSC